MIAVPNDNTPRFIPLHEVVEGIATVAASPALPLRQAVTLARQNTVVLLGRSLSVDESVELDDVLWRCRFTVGDWPRQREALVCLTRFVTEAQRQAAA